MAQQPMDMLPPELQAEQEALLRRQRVADMMTQRGQIPIQGGMAGRAYVAPSWTQGLAQLANAYLGSKTSDDIGAAKKNIAGRYNDMYADEVAKLSAMRSGSAPRPSAVDPQEMEQSADQGTALPGPVQDVKPASQQQIIDAMLASKVPQLRAVGMSSLVDSMKYRAPTKVDAGGNIVLVGPNNEQTFIPKTATPDTKLKEEGLDRRYGTVSANTEYQGRVSMRNTDQTTGTSRANAELAAYTAQRGQNMTAETARRAQDNATNAELQQQLAAAKARGKELAENQVKAAAELPKVISNAETAIGLLDQMIGTEGKKLKPGQKAVAPHPGFRGTIGTAVPGLDGMTAPGMRFVPGSKESDFQSKLDQVLGGAFLTAFETLKGGGQITVIEGDKATAAITRMRTTQSEDEFIKAAREFESIVRNGVDRAKSRVGSSSQVGQGGAPTQNVIDFNNLPQ